MKKIFIILMVLLFATASSSATYYVDAINGNDANDGSSVGEAWETIARAYDSNELSPNVNDGDTVIMRDGDYGVFSFFDEDARGSNWIYYMADTGHEPNFTYIWLGYTTGYRDIYLSFDGIRIQGGNVDNRTVVVYRGRHVKFLNSTFVGDGYTEFDNSAGVYLRNANNITFDNCIIESTLDVPQGGFNRGIFSRYCFDVNIADCDISRCRHGIQAWGDGWTISNNHLYDLDSDGVLLVSVKNATVTNNHIHDIKPPVAFTDSTAATYDDTNGVITASSGTPYADGFNNGHYVRVYRVGGEIIPAAGTDISTWPGVDEYTNTTITLDDKYGGGDYADIVKVEVVKGYHCDGIQAYNEISYDDEEHPDYIYMDNLIVQRNRIYSIDRQGIFFYASWVSGVTIENNLVYDCNGTDVQLSQCGDIEFRNNTVVGERWFRHQSTVDEVTGNILWRSTFWDTNGVPTIEDYNIINQWWSNMHPDFEQGANTVELENDGLFEALFNTYAGEDFTLASDSQAIDFANSIYAPATDLLGYYRDVDEPDAGCYEYGAGERGLIANYFRKEKLK